MTITVNRFPDGLRVAIGLAMGLALAGCGGDGDGGGEEPQAGTATPRSLASPAAVTAGARLRLAAPIIPPLIDDEGHPMPSPPSAVPADTGARTRAARYASPAQARQLEETQGPALLLVNVGCCGYEALDTAIGVAYGLQAAHDLPSSVPVLVRARDLRLGAAAVERLTAEGYGRVWLVTQ